MEKTGRLNYIEMGIDDMTNLVELSDESLLYNLQTRYNQKTIYTYIGSILISINPYTELNIYDKKYITRYQNKSMQEVPPHLFGIAEINYSKMMLERENQVIVISGESGAGKTESFKRILRYLAYTSGGVKDTQSSDRNRSDDIATKILDSTPLLESFGNAKTIRNDNSSRFGKYVEIFFDNGTICGSRTTNYLLEKSRIVNINPDERGYHIFYELLQGLDSYGKSQYFLKNVSDYAYLNNAKKFSVKGRDDGANLKEFMSQWSTLGLTNDDLDVAIRIISAVLHLGNVRFRDEEDASVMLETENVNVVAKMLKVDSASLIGCLTMKTTDTVKDKASSPVNAEQAANLRDTLAKHLYSELFDWIVGKVNESLNQKAVTARRMSNLDKSLNSSTSTLRCIAMLDIYGFENFPENSLEQLCINYANETLQQFFNRYVFELEQAEYKQEGISWHYVTYPDNQPIINLLSAKPSGIIQILNDECSIPQGSDEAFLTKCHNVHQKNANFEKPKKVHPPQFIIRHFAGDIYYNVTGFLEKNRDIIRKEAIYLVEHCGVKEIANMFMRKREKTQKNPNSKARTPAVMADFQNSLTTLLTKMRTCQPWFIRCLKPNNDKQALTFNKDIVMDQMRYTGILETVKIRKSGFPIRIAFSTFLSRFYLLQSKEMRRFAKKDPQEACLKMLPKFNGNRGKDFEVGKSKLFLKEHFARHLELQVRMIREKSAIKIQRKWRAYWKVRAIIVKNRAATKIQAVCRGFIARRRIKRYRAAMVKLQAYVRMQLVRGRFLEKHPEFLKYNLNKVEKVSVSSKSTAMTYKFPDIDIQGKQKKLRNKKAPTKFNYNLLKIPMKLAFLLEKSIEDYGSGHEIPSPENMIQTCRAQHLYNRDEYQLPRDIDEYLIEDYLDTFGNNVLLESKLRPMPTPFLKENLSPAAKDDSLNAHKLILRLLYADSMPWFHRYITGSFLSYMASTSPQIQIEILMQVISETVYINNDARVTGKHPFMTDMESKRIFGAWTILGNILSHVIPVPQIFNYVLKYISDTVGIDQACTCQEKLLQFLNDHRMRIPRLFPASNLEWRANSRGSKTSLNVVHADDVSNSVHVNSFTSAESLANHSLCFRLKRFRVNKGWSISIVTPDIVIDCGGHNYVFDVISGLELTKHWSDIVGYGIEHKFLISRKMKKSKTINSEPSKYSQSKKKHRYPKESLNKSIATISSRKSMDSWVDKYFENSFRHEEGGNIPVQDFIHGLEDELKAQGNANGNQPINPAGNPIMYGTAQLGIPGIMSPPQFQYAPMQYPIPYQPSYLYPPTSDRRYLEETLNSVELENKVIQSSIDKELLQKRLLELRQQGGAQPVSHLPFAPYGYPMQPQYAPMQQPYAPMLYPMPINPSMMQGQYIQQPNFQPSYVQQSFGSSEVGHHSSKSEETAVRKATKSVQTKRKAPKPPVDVTEDDDDINSVDGKIAEEPKKTKNFMKVSSSVKIKRPQPADNENMTASQLRAAEIPKLDISDRAEFLNKFFAEKRQQTPESSKVKRQAPPPPPPMPASPPPPRYEGHVPAPPPLIPQPKLIPRPSISPIKSPSKPISRAITTDDNDTIKDIEIKETFAELDDSFSSVKRSGAIERPQAKKRNKRKHTSSKTAIVLSGLPDIRYYTYMNLPWFPLVKVELLLPKDIQDSTILNPVIFCQIVRDLTTLPSVRWIGNERRDLLMMLGDVVGISDTRKMLATPSNVVLKVIDRAQNCELYFSRFYSIQWISTNASGNICHWLAISHSGIRFVEENIKNPDVGLNLVCRIPYSDVKMARCDELDVYGNPQKIAIITKDNKIFEMSCTHAQSAVDLIHEFIGDKEEANNKDKFLSTNGLPSELFKQKKTKRGQLQEAQFIPESSPALMTLGVNNKRISMRAFVDQPGSTPDPKAAVVRPVGDLVDFMFTCSKKRSREELESVILRWDKRTMNEPLLPSMNSNMSRKVLELYQFILVLSGDLSMEPTVSTTECGVTIFRTIYHSKELMEEVILQIMKQINGNPRQQNRQQLWTLLSTLLIFYAVARRMEPYLLEHLKRMMQNQSNPDNESVVSVLKIMQKTMFYGPRKEMPMENELTHLLGGMKEAKITIYLPRDILEYSIAFNHTVSDVVKNICNSLDLNLDHEISEYSIALVEIDQNNVPIRIAEYLRPELYLFDAINSLTRDKKFRVIFYFSRCSWIFSIKSQPRSQKLINILFNQLSQDTITGNWMICQPGDVKLLKLITAIAYFNLKGQGFEKPISEDILKTVLPGSLLVQGNEQPSKEELVDMIYSTPTVVDITEMKERVDYQRKFIELVSQLPRYGWISLPLLRVSHIPHFQTLTINFTPDYILILNDGTEETILKITPASLTSFQVSKVDSTSAHFIVRFNGIQEVQFSTTKLLEVSFLLNQYQTIRSLLPMRRS